MRRRAFIAGVGGLQAACCARPAAGNAGGRMPEGATAGKIYGVAILTGIGFTMSLFIGTLAFDDENILTRLRLAALIASLASGLVGAIWLLAARSRD